MRDYLLLLYDFILFYRCCLLFFSSLSSVGLLLSLLCFPFRSMFCSCLPCFVCFYFVKEPLYLINSNSFSFICFMTIFFCLFVVRLLVLLCLLALFASICAQHDKENERDGDKIKQTAITCSRSHLNVMWMQITVVKRLVITFVFDVNSQSN